MKKPLADKIRKDLNELNIEFYLLKDYFEDESPNDIDILCSIKNRKALHKVLKKQGYKTFFFGHNAIFYHAYYSGEIIRLHIHFNYFFYLINMKDASKFHYGNKIKKLKKELFVASDIYKYKSGRSSEKYLARIKDGIRNTDEDITTSILKKKFAEESIISFTKETNLKNALDKLKFLPKNKMKKIPFKIFRKIDNLLIYIIKAIKPSPFIAIIGTDGSGKTTSAENITKELRKTKFRVSSVYEGRYKFKYLKFMNKVTKHIGKKKRKSSSSKNSSIVSYKSSFVHYLTPIIYYFEYLLRYIFSTMILRRKNNFVIVDRSFIDVIISKNTNTRIARLCYFLLPKPSHTIFLYNSPDIIAKRKNHPIEDIKLQLESYQNNKKYYSIQIKTDNKEQTKQDILKFILS